MSVALALPAAASAAPLTSLVSAPGAGASGSPEHQAFFRGASSDGTRVFFDTAQSLVAADTDGLTDVYERSGGSTALVSAPGAGASGSPEPAFFVGASSDGTRVFFITAESLVAGDTDGVTDVYERSGGSTALVSAPEEGASGSPFAAFFNRASSDGTRVFFYTPERLVAGDTDGVTDVYERSGGTSTLVSAPTPTASGPPADAHFAGVSSDGTRVFFHTYQSLVAADDDFGHPDFEAIDVYERSGGETTLVSVPGAGADPAIVADAFFAGASSDGTRVFFTTAQRLTGADGDGDDDGPFPIPLGADGADVYERSGQTTTTLVSERGAGASGSSQDVFFGDASSDGTRVLFTTAENLVGADTDGLQDVYERSGEQTTLVSAPGAGAGGDPAFAEFAGASSDGTRVFFGTAQSLVAADTDGFFDVYERSGGTTALVSAPGAGAYPPLWGAYFAGASSDGTRVFFWTADGLVAADTDGVGDIYERSGGTTTLVSAAGPGASGAPADVWFDVFGSSSDGARVFFETTESLVAADTDGFRDVFERSTDNTPPDTQITSGPADGSTIPTGAASFGFTSPDADVDHFECKLDSATYSVCTSPLAYSGLAEGTHAFSVRAVDGLGNTDQSPAARTFTTDTTAPDYDAEARRSQELGKAVAVKVGCDEPCTAKARGTVSVPTIGGASRALATRARRFKLRSTSAQLPADETAKLKLKIPRKAARAIAKALRAGAKPRAKLTVSATDAAGNSSRTRLTVRFKR